MSALRVLQVGVGSVGRRRLQILGDLPGVVVSGAVDTAPNARAAAQRLGAPWVGADLAEGLRQTQPNVVIVSTPHALHQHQVAAALAAGAHVLCEKPLGVNAAVVRELAALAAGAERRLAMSRNHLHLPSVSAALALVRSGQIGTIGDVATQVGHDRGASLTPWHRSAALSGGGCLRDNGAHALLIGHELWALADDAASVAHTEHSESVEDGDVDADVVATLKSVSGRTLRLHVSWRFTDGYRFVVHIQGDRGELKIDGPVGLRHRNLGSPWRELAVDDLGPMTSWRRDTTDFLTFVTTGAGPAAHSAAAALWTAEATDALYRSATSAAPEPVLA